VSKTTLCSRKMCAKYADAILIALRLNEKSSTEKYLSREDIVCWVQDALGITSREKNRLTKQHTGYSVERTIEWSIQLLKQMKLVSNIERGYWGLTNKGRKSRYTHEDMDRAFREMQVTFKTIRDMNNGKA
jgi:restriction endonuclease Mrr